jgi:hypothetical protein
LIDNVSSGLQIRVEGNNNLSDNKWHYVVMTYNGSNTAAGIKLYVDGNEESKNILKEQPLNTIRNQINLQLGSKGGDFNPFNGTMDEIRIYNRVLSQSEIKAHYERRRYTSPEPNITTTGTLRGYYNKIFKNLTNMVSATDYVSYSVEPNVNNLVNMTLVPSSTSVNVTVNEFNASKSSGTLVNFTAVSINGNSVNFTIGNLTSGIYYSLYKDGTITQKVMANSSGYINFNNSIWSEHIFTLEQAKLGGAICSSANECSGGYCVHNICRSASTYCGDGYCDIGETCSSCSIDCGICSTTFPGGGLSTSYDLDKLKEGIKGHYPKNYVVKFNGDFVKVNNISEDKVGLNVSNKIVEIVFENTIKVDSDDDGFYDLEISLGKKNFIYAKLSIKSIYEEMPAVQEGAKVGDGDLELGVGEEEEEKKGFFRRIWEWFIGLFGK